MEKFKEYNNYKAGNLVCLNSSRLNEKMIYIGIHSGSYCFVPVTTTSFLISWDGNTCINKGVPSETIPFGVKPIAYKPLE